MNQDIILFPLELEKGNAEFDGNGPDVTVSTELHYSVTYENRIFVQAKVTMKETGGDTLASATASKTFTTETYDVDATAGNGKNADFFGHYLDTDHQDDDVVKEAQSVDIGTYVTKVVCAGDTSGMDVCETKADCSRCVVSLGCVTLEKK